jgi:hypothetical protein
MFMSALLAGGAHGQLISNGGFESDLTGWTTADLPGSDGGFMSQSGIASPVNGDPVPAPPGGTKAAMTDAQGPGTHVMYQTFTPTSLVGSAPLSFDVFIGNRADTFVTPTTLDFSTPALNQQARVDILLASADPFSIAAADVLLNVYKTNVGDPAISGYTNISTDIAAILNANLGTPLMLRFAEVDNLFTFQLGVDNVTLVPEPASLAMLAVGAMIARRRSRVV